VNVISKRKSSRVRALQFGALSLMLCVMPNSWAEECKPATSQAAVAAAHVPFAGESEPATNMANTTEHAVLPNEAEAGSAAMPATQPTTPAGSQVICTPAANTHAEPDAPQNTIEYGAGG
jgi:hypothetical protein